MVSGGQHSTDRHRGPRAKPREQRNGGHLELARLKLHAGIIRELVGQIRSYQFFFRKKVSGLMEGRLPLGITDGTATAPPKGLAQKGQIQS
jgi:hypothetical protein